MNAISYYWQFEIKTRGEEVRKGMLWLEHGKDLAFVIYLPFLLWVAAANNSSYVFEEYFINRLSQS